jgi:hypothetical protein
MLELTVIVLQKVQKVHESGEDIAAPMDRSESKAGAMTRVSHRAWTIHRQP